MITAVLDTNILASGSLARQGTIAELINSALAGVFQLVLSQKILDELERTLRKPYFAARLDTETVARYIARLKAVALLTSLTRQVTGIATHPEDDLVLATAVSARVTFLVT
jgi:putative PIN family toxin of toxin-antitoxin system